MDEHAKKSRTRLVLTSAGPRLLRRIENSAGGDQWIVDEEAEAKAFGRDKPDVGAARAEVVAQEKRLVVALKELEPFRERRLYEGLELRGRRSRAESEASAATNALSQARAALASIEDAGPASPRGRPRKGDPA